MSLFTIFSLKSILFDVNIAILTFFFWLPFACSSYWVIFNVLDSRSLILSYAFEFTFETLETLLYS